MFCKNCGKQIDDNAEICIHCGVKVDACLGKTYTKKFCAHCGREIDGNAYVCVYCGVKTESDMPAKRKSSMSLFGIISFICSFLSITLSGAILAVYGLTVAKKSNDKSAFSLNVAALIFSVVMSVLIIVLNLL